jgi:hypothetical protein
MGNARQCADVLVADIFTTLGDGSCYMVVPLLYHTSRLNQNEDSIGAPTSLYVTVGRVSTARLLGMGGNHGQLFGSLRQAFHAESASL